MPEQNINWKNNFAKIKRQAIPTTIGMGNTQVGGGNLPFILFGANKWLSKLHYGSAASIKFQIAGGATTQAELLKQSQTQPFRVTYWNIVSDDVANVNQALTITYQDANGTTINEVVTLGAYFDMYQISQNEVVFKYPVKVDGDFWISGYMTPSSKMLILPYPDSIVNTSNALFDEGDVVEQFDIPPMSNFIEFLNKIRNGKV